jgi:colicin import membrane protein
MTTAELRLPPPPEQGKWASIGLTAFVHGILLLVLFFSVRWQTRPPEAVEVELIREMPVQAAAPRAAQPEPEPEPAVEPRPVPKAEPKPPEPKPEPKPQPKARPEPVAKPVSKPVPAKPDIALKDKQAPKPQAKPEPKPKPAPKAEAKPAAKPEPKAPPKAEKKPVTKPEPAPEHLSRAEEAQRNKLLDEELRRDTQRLAQAKLQGEAEKEMASLQKQRAAAATGRALADWIEKVKRRIKANAVVPPDVEGNPELVFSVTLLPTGEVLDPRLTRSSGNPSLDSAIERAIKKSSPLPKPEQIEMPRTFRLVYRPLED